MLSSNIQKIILVVVLVLGFGFLGYYLYFGGGISLTSDILVSEDSTPVGQDILVLAQQLNSISIDQSIFASPLFANLRDVSATIIPEDRGRNNPFLTIGVEGAAPSAVQPLLRVPSGR